ncbi:TRAPP trafficking subunit Trs65-domain-containing protein, partial [Scleroderma citrinum]
SFETLFGSCLLEVTAPDTSIGFPENVLADDWLASLKEPQVDRRQAFFDERLRLYLIVRIDYRYPQSHNSTPPAHLVDFLRHIQVSLEATYISQKSAASPDVPPTPQIVGPPRSSSVGLATPRPTSLHPSIFPPATPNPIPSTTEGDRKYVQSEGTLLLSSVWGSRLMEHSGERFALLFSELQGIWVGVYEFTLDVSFLRLPFDDPLLCLTCFATLRERALSLLQTTHPFVKFLLQQGLVPSQDAAEDRSSVQHKDPDDGEQDDSVFEEVNLLDALAIGSSLSSDTEPLYLPSTRLGNVTRRQLFSLPSISSSSESTLIDAGSKRGPHHVLRKSFRKTLQMASGFRVRMRTVFVPHVLLPKDRSASETSGVQDDENDFDGGNEEREAGNSERTVVLCIEVENSGDPGPHIGFSLERIDVKIGGEGTTTRLIGWGDDACKSGVEEGIFPLFLGPMEQYNLLYVVSFLNVINHKDGFPLSASSAKLGTELQRAVTISIHGRPYFFDSGLEGDSKDPSSLSYPTRTFSSKWNCILDLSREDAVRFQDQCDGQRSAFPEPPSPFPGALSSVFVPPTAKPVPWAVAGKRLDIPSNVPALRAMNPAASARLSLPSRDYPNSPIPTSQMSHPPPSAAMQIFARSRHTTLRTGSSDLATQSFVTPPTLAYLPDAGVNHVSSTQTLGGPQGLSRPSTESRRDRNSNPMLAPLGKSGAPQESFPPTAEPIIVSVGLKPSEGASEKMGQRKIYPSDVFTLDIFVFNQSSWTRRFEISYLGADRGHEKVGEGKGSTAALDELKSTIIPPGILPLQNRVRVGPLRPSTCQSVCLDFLALSPGVHLIEALTLVDIETGHSMNLRSVMDIVVHETSEERALNVREGHLT